MVTPAMVLSATVDDVLGKLGAAFRVSMPLVLSTLFLMLISFLVPGDPIDPETPASVSEGVTLDPLILSALIFGLLAFVVCWLWTAVAWHRYVILGEQPGAVLPPWQGSRILGYLGRSILVFLVVFAISIVPILIAAGIAPTSITEDAEYGATRNYEFFGAPPDYSPLSIAVWIVLAALIWGVSLRVGIILPAGAVGNPKRLGEVWTATKGRFLNLFAPLGLVIALSFAVLDLVSSVLSLGGVAELASLWLQAMIGIGILTRLHIGFFGAAPESPVLDSKGASTL